MSKYSTPEKFDVGGSDENPVAQSEQAADFSIRYRPIVEDAVNSQRQIIAGFVVVSVVVSIVSAMAALK